MIATAIGERRSVVHRLRARAQAHADTPDCSPLGPRGHVARRLRTYRRADAALQRHASDRLPDRRSRQRDGPPPDGAHLRPSWHPHLCRWPARRRTRHARDHHLRRPRHEPCLPVPPQFHRARHNDPVAALPVPLEGSHAPRPRWRTGPRDPRHAREARPHRTLLLRLRSSRPPT
jgi:hypothetical protein